MDNFVYTRKNLMSLLHIDEKMLDYILNTKFKNTDNTFFSQQVFEQIKYYVNENYDQIEQQYQDSLQVVSKLTTKQLQKQLEDQYYQQMQFFVQLNIVRINEDEYQVTLKECKDCQEQYFILNKKQTLNLINANIKAKRKAKSY